MKRLVYTAALSLATLGVSIANATCSSTAYGNTTNTTAYGNISQETETFPYLFGSAAFPQRCRPSIATSVRHSFKLQIPRSSSALLQLNIAVPQGLKVSKKITITDQSKRKIAANISVHDSKVIIQFTQPIIPGTRLNIDMNNVRVLGFSNAWLYSVSVTLVGHDTNIPIGLVRFGIY